MSPEPQNVARAKRSYRRIGTLWGARDTQQLFYCWEAAPQWLVSDCHQVQKILFYEDSVAAHLSKILTSDQHSVVISSAKVLCETVKDFVARVGKAYEKATESSEESEVMARKVKLEKMYSFLLLKRKTLFSGK